MEFSTFGPWLSGGRTDWPDEPRYPAIERLLTKGKFLKGERVGVALARLRQCPKMNLPKVASLSEWLVSGQRPLNLGTRVLGLPKTRENEDA